MDYNNGKLYRIYNPQIEESLEYVGSTCQPLLCTRMAIHRYGYKSRRLKMIGQVTQERKNTVNIRFAGRGRDEYNEIYHRQPHILALKNAYSKARYARLKATPEGRAKAIAYGKARYARLKAEKDTTNLEEV